MEMRSRPPNPSAPYREDCWSEGETSVLIDAWGDRFLDLDRGNLRQKQWHEVAVAVNARSASGRRPPRTDGQCKNRIDTLKKKYKVEKGRISNGVRGSGWVFYSRLDVLIGSNVKDPAVSSPLPPVALLVGRNYVAAAAAAAAEAGVGSGSSDRLSASSEEGKRSRKRRKGGGGGGGMSELAGVIEWFADVYEKMEIERQRQMVELEKERIKFIKGLEFQRMQMFLDTQVQVEKIKLARRSDAGEETNLN